MSTYFGSVVSDEEEDLKSRKSIDKWIYRLLLILIGVMPLIVLSNVEEVISPLISNFSTLQSGVKGELFTHFKSLFLMIITIIVSILFLVKVFFINGTIRTTPLNYVLGTFVIAIVISTVMSPNITIALNGLYNRSDGAISWLCYVTLVFIGMNIEYPKNFVRSIMYTMMPFVFINLYIITMNFNGNDLLQKTWFQKIVTLTLPEGASLDGGSMLLGTLNQWNYMSGMFAMMTVMYLAWAVTTKKWIEAIAGAITASASITIMFMSVSTSGFLTVLVILPFIFVNIFRTDKKAISVVALVVFLIISTPVFNFLAEKDERIWIESFGFIFEKNPYLDEAVPVSKTGEEKYKPSISNVAYASEQAIELPTLPRRAYSAGSGRIYIWDKTLDLVKERAITGYGADTIMYNFPHLNSDARAGLRDETTIVDKPHNVYIGTLYGFGIIGLLALVSVLLVVGINFIRSILTKSWELFIFATVGLAYFLQAMFNDSLPGISGVAWLFVGIMFALMYNGKEESITDGRNN